MLSVRAPHICNCILRRQFVAPLQSRLNSNSAEPNPIVQSSSGSTDGQSVSDALGRKQKLPQRKPLVKNFMLGIVDKELLRYPEVLSRDDTNKLEEETAATLSYFKDSLDANSIDRTYCIPKEVVDDLKGLRLFGYNIPEDYAGSGYNATQLSVASENEQVSTDIAATLMPHRVVSEFISEFGTDYIKDKYLSKMANGTIVASEAIFESKTTDARFFGTFAEYNETNKVWTLNGEKSFVINANNADIFLIMTQINFLNNSGDIVDNIAMFLVESTLPGVEVTKNDSFGIKGAGYGTVLLKNVNVPEGNLIGNIEDANAIAQSLLKFNRIKSGLLSVGMLKNITKDLAHYATYTKQNGIYLKDLKQISDRLARLVCSTYAVESMLYLTCGLVDEFHQQDVDLEAAILKLYSLETVWKTATSAMEYMGPKCFENGQQTERYLRNAAQLYTQNESPDSMRQFIGLTGIQYAGMNLFETIRKDRNPFSFPKHVFNRMFESQSIDSPKMILHLEGEVHPSLDQASKNLEVSILRLRLATEALLVRYGNEILNEPLEVARITECMCLIYGMFASIARASRSYCIGLQYSDYELLIATMLAVEGASRIEVVTKDIVNGPYMTNDANNQKIAKQFFKSQKYFYQHPLKFNF